MYNPSLFSDSAISVLPVKDKLTQQTLHAMITAQLVHPQMVTLDTHKGALQQTWPGHRCLLSNIDHGKDQ